MKFSSMDDVIPVCNPSHEWVDGQFKYIGVSVTNRENKDNCKTNDFRQSRDPGSLQVTDHRKKHQHGSITAPEIRCTQGRTSLFNFSSINTQEKDESNNVCNHHAIPDRDYMNFISRIEKVGKADALVPNLASNPRALPTEISAPSLENEKVDCNENGKVNNEYNIHSSYLISDSDYAQFCGRFRENANRNMLRPGSKHRRACAATTVEGVTSDGELKESVGQKDLKNMYNDHSIPDPGYLLFLDHLREDGNSYFLELANDNDSSSMIYKYEEEDDKVQEKDKIPRLKKRRISQNIVTAKMSGQKRTTNSDTNHSIPNEKAIPDNPVVIDSHVDSRCLYVDASYQKYLDHLILVDGELVFDMKSDASKSASEAPPNVAKNRDVKGSSMDAAYVEFLNHLRLQDGFMILDLKSDGSIRYEEETKGPISGFTRLQKENTSTVDQCLMPYNISNLGSDSQLKVFANNTRELVAYSEANSFHYKDKLIELISRPYDHNEYEDLLEKATVRKPLCRQRNLRNMSKIYATDLQGLSYLDHHPKLAKQLKEADCLKRLRLLRGFFFWLKNLCHDGAFQPWMPLQARSSPTTDGEDGLSSDDVSILE